MATERTTGVEPALGSAYQPEPRGSKRQLKAQIDRTLRSLIAANAEAIIEELARGLSKSTPILELEDIFPEDLGWFYTLSDAGSSAYVQLLAAAQHEVSRLIEEYKIHHRSDVVVWQAWLEKRARFWAAQHARAAEVRVAERMAAIFSTRYGVPIAHYCAHGAATFFIHDAMTLGDGWVLLRDSIVRGETPADRDYLRVVYAYHPERQLLLRLHHTHIHIPLGRWACRWIISKIWENIDRPEADLIAGCC